MDDKVKHVVDGNKFIIEMIANRFTQDIVGHINSAYPFSEISLYNTIEFNLEQVKMIDSSSIGYLFSLHNRLSNDEGAGRLVVNVGKNRELKDLLHRFQVDLLLDVK